jgi:hypothetical protein
MLTFHPSLLLFPFLSLALEFFQKLKQERSLASVTAEDNY